MEEDTTTNYRIKDIVFFGSARRILLQSANGPCPLLAICNVLLLRNQIKIQQDARYISFNELVEIVSGFLFDSNQGGGDSPSPNTADLRENLTSCLDILPRLNVGLDVNCQFGGATAFEFTREMAVFDLLDIVLFHGWVVSKQDELAHSLLANLSYNQVVERLIAMQEAQGRQQQQASQLAPAPGEDGSASAAAHAADAAPRAADAAGAPSAEDDAKVVQEGLIIQDFLDRTASQLSYDGLLALHDIVRERQLGVFFRNSHFNSMLKYEGDLYLLCTDISFAHSHVVWERLDEVDGDTSYCDANFKVNQSGSDEAANLVAAQAAQDTLFAGGAGGSMGGMEDADRQLVLQLMQEDLQQQDAARRPAAPAQQPALPQLAQQQPAAAGRQQQGLLDGQTGRSSDRDATNKKKCCIVQ